MRAQVKRSVMKSTPNTIGSRSSAACQRGQVFGGRLFGDASGFAVVLMGMLLLVGCSQPPHPEILPPAGYRAIAESEYPDDWRMVAELIPTPDRAEGDFDGDSEPDQARLWIQENGTGWVLLAYLSSLPNEPILMYESSRPLGPRPIRTIPPGEHKTDRYYGIGPGGPDSTAVVHLLYDAINLAWVESEGTTYIWNLDLRKFEPVGMY